MRHWLLLTFASISGLVCAAYNGCLHQRSVCLRTPECRGYLDDFEATCGFSLSVCGVESPSDCVHTLWRIRDFFPYDTCVCYEALGFAEECNHFRELIWNHPCERRLRDAGEQRKALERPYVIDSLTSYRNTSLRRTTRTPLSDQIRQLKNELSFELGTREVIRSATCDSALNDVCLRHVSCRQLWKLFRSSCGVDQENRCTMTDRETCWQSFEGLTWTGLGNCHCDTANSDCHWIRLHTTYNKCINDILASGQIPPSMYATGNVHPHGHRTQVKHKDKLKGSHSRSTAAPATRPPEPSTTTSTSTSTTTTTTTTTITTTSTTTTTPPTTTTKKPKTKSSHNGSLTAHRYRQTTPSPAESWNRRQMKGESDARTTAAPIWRHTTTPSVVRHSNQQRHVPHQAQTDVHYLPLFEPQVKTTPAYYYHYTTAIPRWDQSLQSTRATFSQKGNNDVGAPLNEHRSELAEQRHSANGRYNSRQQPLRIHAKLDPIQLHNAPTTQSTLLAFGQKEFSLRIPMRVFLEIFASL